MERLCRALARGGHIDTNEDGRGRANEEPESSSAVLTRHALKLKLARRALFSLSGVADPLLARCDKRPAAGRIARPLGIRSADRISLDVALDRRFRLDREAAFRSEAAVALNGPRGFAADRQILASNRIAGDGNLNVVFPFATDRRPRGRIALRRHFRLTNIDAVETGSPGHCGNAHKTSRQ